jgi:hypothetical protein
MDICVVGNGPLSKENRAQIQKCELVVRFNDCKNMKKNERMDIHVMREIGNKHTYSGFNECKLKDNSNMDIVLVGENATADYYEDRNIIQRIKLNGTSYNTFNGSMCPSINGKSEIDKWP